MKANYKNWVPKGMILVQLSEAEINQLEKEASRLNVKIMGVTVYVLQH